MTIKNINENIEWENWKVEENDIRFGDGQNYYEIPEVLSSQLNYLAENVKDLARENGDDHNELADHLETIEQVKYILSLLGEESLYKIEKEKYCRECMSSPCQQV